jgi:glutathione S-transferase
LIELIADLSDEELLPKDPVLKAKARFFIETVTPLVAGAFRGAMAQGQDPEAIFKAVETIQKLLPAEGYAVGNWSIADAAVTPFFARAEVVFKNDIGVYEEGKGKAAWAKLENDEKYARFRKYFNDIKARDSFKETFHPVSDIHLPQADNILMIFSGCHRQYLFAVVPEDRHSICLIPSDFAFVYLAIFVRYSTLY